MTLIVYSKCLDATIIATDKKQSDPALNQTQSVRKYFLPEHHQYVLSLAGEGTRVDTITTPLEIDQTPAVEIKEKIRSVVEIPRDQNMGTSDGFLLLLHRRPFEFYHLWTITNKLGINHDNPPFECYGDGSILAKYFLHKFDLSNSSWNIAIQYLVAIMQEVAQHNDSVGSMEQYGFDFLIILNNGEIKETVFDKNSKVKKIDSDFKPDTSLKLKPISKKAIIKKQQKTSAKEKTVKEKYPKLAEGTVIKDTKGLFAEPKLKLSKTFLTKPKHPPGTGSLIVQTDRSVYIYDTNMIVTIINPFPTIDSPILLKIINKSEKVVYKKLIPIDSGTNGTYQDVVSIKGKGWDVRGEEFKVIAEYAGKVSEVSIWRSDFGATIELDQKVYTWTDKVYITVIAPDYSLNKDKPTSIGQPPDQKITISTSKGEIQNYKLIETGKNTGIFTGEVCLTGFKGHVSKGYQKEVKGSTDGSNSGPKDGLIACSNDDYVSVAFTTRYDTVMGSALIRWNIAELEWLEPSYSKNGIGKIRVVDPDMNLNPDEIDEFKIRVWSDTDAKGLSITVTETGEATGIFEGIVKFSSKKKPKELFVQDGDTVTAEYKDTTLPDPYTTKDELKIAATTVIGALMPPLEKVLIKNHKIVDEQNKLVKSFHVKQKVLIIADLFNQQQKSQPFVFLAQIQDESGVTIQNPSITGSLSNRQQMSLKLPWSPQYPGNYLINSYVWENIDNPIALSQAISKRIQVNETKNKISVPAGTSVPGCEVENRCYVPPTLKIKKGQSVEWTNDDSAAHTITSGTPDKGPDGKFDSSLFMSKETFTHFFKDKGKYHYFCMVHPWQNGEIIVE